MFASLGGARSSCVRRADEIATVVVGDDEDAGAGAAGSDGRIRDWRAARPGAVVWTDAGTMTVADLVIVADDTLGPCGERRSVL